MLANKKRRNFGRDNRNFEMNKEVIVFGNGNMTETGEKKRLRGFLMVVRSKPLLSRSSAYV